MVEMGTRVLQHRLRSLITCLDKLITCLITITCLDRREHDSKKKKGIERTGDVGEEKEILEAGDDKQGTESEDVKYQKSRMRPK